jgi:hypothetical protein
MTTIRAEEVWIPRRARDAVARHEQVVVVNRERPAYVIVHPDDRAAASRLARRGRPLREALGRDHQVRDSTDIRRRTIECSRPRMALARQGSAMAIYLADLGREVHGNAHSSQINDIVVDFFNRRKSLLALSGSLATLIPQSRDRLCS